MNRLLPFLLLAILAGDPASVQAEAPLPPGYDPSVLITCTVTNATSRTVTLALSPPRPSPTLVVGPALTGTFSIPRGTTMAMYVAESAAASGTTLPAAPDHPPPAPFRTDILGQRGESAREMTFRLDDRELVLEEHLLFSGSGGGAPQGAPEVPGGTRGHRPHRFTNRTAAALFLMVDAQPPQVLPAGESRDILLPKGATLRWALTPEAPGTNLLPPPARDTSRAGSSSTAALPPVIPAEFFFVERNGTIIVQ